MIFKQSIKFFSYLILHFDYYLFSPCYNMRTSQYNNKLELICKQSNNILRHLISDTHKNIYIYIFLIIFFLNYKICLKNVFFDLFCTKCLVNIFHKLLYFSKNSSA
jgi:hypothetical protein